MRGRPLRDGRRDDGAAVPHSRIKAVAILLCAAAATAHAQPIASSPPAAPVASDVAASPTWRSIYENSQKIYYLGAANASGNASDSGQIIVESLLEFKIPQVVNGDQVWSIVTRMKLNCERKQILTTGNTLYALKMGTGPVVQSQAVSDTWHQPQPGSLGGLIWSTACAKP